ncbi:MAG: PEP-CTERM sorting domain-containing protein, partial [Planctomycetota bacterium]
EHAHIGVAGDGVTRNHLFELTSGGCCDFSGSGHFISISGDGGDSSDYRHWQDNANGSGSAGPVNQFDESYLAPDMGTNVTSDNFVGFYEEIANFDAPIPGVIGNGWATVRAEVSQTDGKVRYAIRGASPETTGIPGVNADPEFLTIVETDIEAAEGFVSFGLADLYSSVAPDSDNQYAIFDNFLVTGSNLPGGGGIDGDFNDDSAWDCADVNALTTEIVAGTNNSDFDLNGDNVVDQADLTEWLIEGGAENAGVTGGNAFLAADANLDGSADVGDFNAWNANKFTSNSNFCDGDFNADGVVDVSDFGIWNAQKFTSSAAPAPVPEPSTLSLLLIAGLALLRRKR